jgi:hypothetical protein
MSEPFVPTIACPAPALPPGAQGLDRVAVDDAALRLVATFARPVALPAQSYLLDPRSYTLSGGQRLFPRVIAAALFDPPGTPADLAGRRVALTLSELGDFSIYTLTVSGPDLDPFFISQRLRFRLDCDDPFDCRAPAPAPAPAPRIPVAIDYLAKDYAGFRQALIDFIPTRLPAWTERSEADIGMMLLELFAATADTLSYMQDRVANEAFLATASQRRSVAAHLALLGYAMDEGAAALTWLQFQVNARAELRGEPGLRVSTSPRREGEPVLVFETLGAATLRPEHNQMAVYDWGNAGCCLPRAARALALVGSFPDLRAGDFLLLDAGPDRRDVVRLTDPPQLVAPGDGGEPPASPPAPALTVVRWGPETPLAHDYCVDASLVARGNLVPATHGETVVEELTLDVAVAAPGQPAPRRRVRLAQGPLAHLDPATLALAQPTAAVPEDAGSLRAFLARTPRSVAALALAVDGAPWSQVGSLLDSQADDAVFRLEIDDDGDTTIVFGDGVFGARPPEPAALRATYRVGGGAAGNLAADTLVRARPAAGASLPWLVAVNNPLPATGGRDLESRGHARRFAPETFQRPLVAVTAEDYEGAARELSFAGERPIQRARAAFRWTGSWLTVFLAVDPQGEEGLSDELRRALLAHLDGRRLAGYDLEIVRAVYAPIELTLALCLAPGLRAGDVLQALTGALGTGQLPGGASGFFHPDNFSFGDRLFVSRIFAAVMAVPGVESAEIRRLARLSAAHPDADTAANLAQGFLALGGDEIVQLDNDPNFPERGVLRLEVKGGGA